MNRPLIAGILLWIGGTVTVRLAGAHIFRIEALLLYGASFAAMFLIVPPLLRRLGVEKEAWPRAVTLLMLPTLILDPLTCAFFPSIFPNADPAAAGIFGGWMLICCGGAAVGAWMPSVVRR